MHMHMHVSCHVSSWKPGLQRELHNQWPVEIKWIKSLFLPSSFTLLDLMWTLVILELKHAHIFTPHVIEVLNCTSAGAVNFLLLVLYKPWMHILYDFLRYFLPYLSRTFQSWCYCSVPLTYIILIICLKKCILLTIKIPILKPHAEREVIYFSEHLPLCASHAWALHSSHRVKYPPVNLWKTQRVGLQHLLLFWRFI